MSRKERGFIYIGRYHYVRQNKRSGRYQLYEGCWSGKGEDSTEAPLVVRDDKTKKVLEFDSVDDARRFKGLI
jgi:hypothetical protein